MVKPIALVRDGYLHPAISVSRSGGAATRTNVKGLIEPCAAHRARFDYEPGTTRPLGRLVEAARTNLLRYTDQLDNAVWLKSNCAVTANAIPGVDGTTSVDYITATSAASPRIYQSVTVAAATAHTFSVGLLYGNNPWVNINVYDGAGNGRRVWVNVLTGAIGASAAIGVGLTLGTVTASVWAAGFWRVAMTVTTGADTTLTVEMLPCTGDGSIIGVNGATLNITGAQLEAGAGASTYIPAIAASVTRHADVLTIPTSAIPYNPSEGTIIAMFDCASAPELSSVVATLYADNNNYIGIDCTSADKARAQVRAAGAYAAISLGAFAASAPVKVAMAYRSHDFALCVDGGAVQTDASIDVPGAATALNIGAFNGTSFLGGHVRQLLYVPRRLSNADLQFWTS